MSINNKHFIRVDEHNRVIAGLTDDIVAYPDGVRDSDIFTHESGGWIFEMLVDDKWLANPLLTNDDGIYLYKCDGEISVSRTQDEIDADTPPQPELLPSPSAEQMLAALMRGYLGEAQEDTELRLEQIEQIGRNIKAAEEAVEAVEQMRILVDEQSQQLLRSRELLDSVAIAEEGLTLKEGSK